MGIRMGNPIFAIAVPVVLIGIAMAIVIKDKPKLIKRLKGALNRLSFHLYLIET